MQAHRTAALKKFSPSTDHGDSTELVFIDECRSGQALDRELADAFSAGSVAQAEPLLARPLTLQRYSAA